MTRTTGQIPWPLLSCQWKSAERIQPFLLFRNKGRAIEGLKCTVIGWNVSNVSITVNEGLPCTNCIHDEFTDKLLMSLTGLAEASASSIAIFKESALTWNWSRGSYGGSDITSSTLAKSHGASVESVRWYWPAVVFPKSGSLEWQEKKRLCSYLAFPVGKIWLYSRNGTLEGSWAWSLAPLLKQAQFAIIAWSHRWCSPHLNGFDDAIGWQSWF